MAENPLHQPEPRFYPAVASVGGKLYVWGGRTEEFESGSKSGIAKLASRVDCFDPQSEVWSIFNTLGKPHPGLSYCACTSFGEHIYMYGGHSDTRDVCQGVLSSLNIKTLSWSQLSSEASDGPMRKTACGMVHLFNDNLLVIGGYGHPKDKCQHGASLLKNGPNLAWTNEIHIFNKSLGMVLICF